MSQTPVYTCGIDVAYSDSVSTAEYPNEWAKLIAEVLSRPDWDRARLINETGSNRNTIMRWLSGETFNVSTAKIRKVADATGIDYDIAVAAVLGAKQKQRAEDERAIRLINESKASDELKERLIAHVRKMSSDHADERVRAIEILLDEAANNV